MSSMLDKVIVDALQVYQKEEILAGDTAIRVASVLEGVRKIYVELHNSVFEVDLTETITLKLPSDIEEDERYGAQMYIKDWDMYLVIDVGLASLDNEISINIMATPTFTCYCGECDQKSGKIETFKTCNNCGDDVCEETKQDNDGLCAQCHEEEEPHEHDEMDEADDRYEENKDNELMKG